MVLLVCVQETSEDASAKAAAPTFGAKPPESSTAGGFPSSTTTAAKGLTFGASKFAAPAISFGSPAPSSAQDKLPGAGSAPGFNLSSSTGGGFSFGSAAKGPAASAG